MTAIVGYNGNPSLVEVATYLVYLVLALWSYFRTITAKSEKKAVA